MSGMFETKTSVLFVAQPQRGSAVVALLHCLGGYFFLETIFLLALKVFCYLLVHIWDGLDLCGIVYLDSTCCCCY